MKFLLAVAVLVASCAALAPPQSHNATFGKPGVKDVLLYEKLVEKSGKLLKVITEDITYPPKGVIAQHVITTVHAIDLMKAGKGGYASLLAGGPTAKNVTIHLKSQRGSGLKFLLRVFGH